jgi:Lar family restriction alleviation protein
MNHDLKPCPFCGGEAVLSCNDDARCISYVLCSQCNVRGPSRIEKDDAIAQWNERIGESV